MTLSADNDLLKGAWRMGDDTRGQSPPSNFGTIYWEAFSSCVFDAAGKMPISNEGDASAPGEVSPILFGALIDDCRHKDRWALFSY